MSLEALWTVFIQHLDVGDGFWHEHRILAIREAGAGHEKIAVGLGTTESHLS